MSVQGKEKQIIRGRPLRSLRYSRQLHAIMLCVSMHVHETAAVRVTSGCAPRIVSRGGIWKNERRIGRARTDTTRAEKQNAVTHMAGPNDKSGLYATCNLMSGMLFWREGTICNADKHQFHLNVSGQDQCEVNNGQDGLGNGVLPWACLRGMVHDTKAVPECGRAKRQNGRVP